MSNECNSVRDTRELARQPENELLDAFAVNPRCTGVTVFRDPDIDYEGGWSQANENNDKLRHQKPHWRLILEYNPGHKEYSWTLSPNDNLWAFVEGEGRRGGPFLAVATHMSCPGFPDPRLWSQALALALAPALALALSILSKSTGLQFHIY